MKNYVLGVDGGGTKTAFALFDENKNMLETVTGAGSNHENLETAFDGASDIIINGLIVCGSPSRNPATGAGRMLARLIASIKGDRHRPSLIHKMAFESFNSRFVSEGENAWLSTDGNIVKEYNDDPLCGYMFTANGFTGLFDLMLDTYSDK